MIRFRSLAAGLVVASLLAGGVVFAQAPGRGPGGRGGRVAGPARSAGLPLAQLKLTDSQRQQIRDLVQKRQQAGEAVRERLRAAMNARRVAMEAIPVNEDAIRSTTTEVAAAEAETAILQARLRADVFALLTPEQQDQVKKLESERRRGDEPRARRQNDRRDRPQR